MATVLPIDELNQLQISMESVLNDNELSNAQKKKLISDDIEDYYILFYMLGAERTENNFNRDYDVDEDKMFDAVYKKYDNQDFRQRVSAYVDANDIAGLKNLADTGMTRLFSTGAWDAAEAFGGGRKRWETMEDDRVRATHEFLQGARVPMEERFHTFDGDSARYPGDFSDAHNNCNCRCWIDILPE